MQDPSIYEPLLVELLSNSPVIGATLKQRLTRLANERGLPPFSLDALGYRSFKAYLKNGASQLVTVMPPAGPGDILVILNQVYRDQASASESPLAESLVGQAVRNAVWQAFCNPDDQRKRYFHRSTGAIRHFLTSEDTPLDIQNHPNEFIEINPISGARQLEWMRDYVSKLQKIGFISETVNELVKSNYTSGLNKAFTQELDTYAEGWRKERTELVITAIHHWASENKVPPHILYVAKDVRTAQPSAPVTAQTNTHALAGTREKVHKLLEVLSDEEIARLVMPTILNAILTSTQS